MSVSTANLRQLSTATFMIMNFTAAEELCFFGGVAVAPVVLLSMPMLGHSQRSPLPSKRIVVDPLK